MESEWVDLRCTWIEEARWCRAVLEEAGIESSIPDEHTLALPLLPHQDPGTVRLLVRAGDLERALDVLDARGPWIPAE